MGTSSVTAATAAAVFSLAIHRACIVARANAAAAPPASAALPADPQTAATTAGPQVGGAACTALAISSVATAPMAIVWPLRRKKDRSFSTARETRIRAASSLTPIEPPTSASVFRW